MGPAWGLMKDCTGQMGAWSPHISGTRIKLWVSQQGFTGNKQMRDPVHLNSPPWCSSPHWGTQPAFLCQILVIMVLLASRWVQRHFPPHEHRSSRQSPAHFTRSSHPFHWQSTRYYAVQNNAHGQKLREFSLARMVFVHWPWQSSKFILAHKVEVSSVRLSSQFNPQRWGETAILKEMHPTCLRQVSQCGVNCPGEIFVPLHSWGDFAFLHSRRKDLDLWLWASNCH